MRRTLLFGSAAGLAFDVHICREQEEHAMQENGFRTLVATCAGDPALAASDRAAMDALVRCAGGVAVREIDCPLGALVLTDDRVRWFRASRALLGRDARCIDAVLLAAVCECAVRRRQGTACPLAQRTDVQGFSS